MKDLIFLFSCDAWKSKGSYSLVMGSVSPTKIRNEVKRQVRAGHMSMEGEITRKDSLEDINKELEYGHIMIVKDGEKQ